MTYLETINIRTAGPIEAAKVLELCSETFQSIAVDQLMKVAVYSNAAYATDISIQLQWKSDPGSESVLGRALREALGDLGLINHTTWAEHEELTAGRISAEAI
jgi:hypothetical protein